MVPRASIELHDDRVQVTVRNLGTYTYYASGTWRERRILNKEFRQLFGWDFTNIVRTAWKAHRRDGYRLTGMWLSRWQQLGIQARAAQR